MCVCVFLCVVVCFGLNACSVRVEQHWQEVKFLVVVTLFYAQPTAVSIEQFVRSQVYVILYLHIVSVC